MKKIVKSVLFVLIVVVLSAFDCVHLHEDDNWHYHIYFENCWEKPVFLGHGIDWHWVSDPFMKYYKSTERPLNECDAFNIVMPGQTDSEQMKRHVLYECSLQDGDSVYILVYDAEQPNKKASECLLILYLLSLEDLHKVNYRITYPPKEEMRNFQMWPSYDEVMKNCKPVN